MLEDSPIITGCNDARIQLVRGCPCLKEFGEERVCVNNDDIIPIKSMTIDPQFFVQLGSIDELNGFKSEREDMCYGLLSLDSRDGKTYCISQGKALSINKRLISAADIKDALNFVVPTTMGNDDAVCSACLYKYLVTLTDIFDDIISKEEKGKVIMDYAQDLVNRIANELSHSTIPSHANSASSVENPHSIQYSVLDYEAACPNEDIKELLNLYKKLSRLEAIFLNQVVSVNQETTNLLALTLVKLMVGTTRRILALHDQIRDLTQTIRESDISPEGFTESLEQTEMARRKSEKDFRKLMPLLSEISIKPPQKVL